MKKGFHPKLRPIYVRAYNGSVFVLSSHINNYDYLLNLRKLLQDKKQQAK